MATSRQQGNPTSAPADQTSQSRPMPQRSGARTLLMTSLLILALLIGSVMWLAYSSGLLGGGETFEESVYSARKQDFLVTVIEDGNLESAKNVDVKCQVAGGSSILSIVEDGAFVEEGQEIITLESSALVDQINQQKNTYEKARAAKIQAEKDHSVAKISVKEFLQGTFEQDLQTAATAITVAEENLRSAKNSLEFSLKMFRKGYISKLELESQQFNVERAKLELDSANTSRNVLMNFTKAKVLEDLSSAVETTKAKMDSEIAAFALEESRLRRFESQLENCIIRAPQSGMVVYANERGRFGSQGVSVEEGAVVREQQTMVRLPDLSEMQVKVLIHESKIEQLQIGQQATVRLLDKIYEGKVVSVANQPESTSFFSAGTKEYSTIVRINETTGKLKPGMTCETEILIARVQDAVAIPIAAVVQISGKHLCWVKSGNEYQKRELQLGWSNEDVVEIKQGVEPGEVVIKNPKRFADKARVEAEAEGATAEKFGGSKEGASGQQPKGKQGGGRPKSADANGKPDRSGSGQTGPGQASSKQSGNGQPGSGQRGSEQPGAGSTTQQGGGRSGAGGGRSSLMDNDKNGDGKISKDEAPSWMQSFFGRLDTNSDGFVDAKEIEESRRRREGGGGGRPGG